MVDAESISLPISRVHIDTSKLAIEDRFEAWRAFDNVVSDISPNADGVRDPEASATLWHLDTLTVAKKAFAPHYSCRRVGDRRIKWNEHLRLRLYEKGEVRGLFGEVPTVLKAGDIHIADMSVDFRTSAGHMEHITILMPYAAVGYDPSRHPRQMRISTETSTGRVLEAAMRCLIDQLPCTTISESQALAQGVTGLVRGLLLDKCPDDQACAQTEDAQRYAMRRYIDEHIEDLGLCVDTLCKNFHASRATIYRHFGEVGGVARYVKERRLDRAFNELAASPARRGRVRAVAERWGFFEAGHFNRIFRQRFGLSPSEVVALDEVGDASSTLDTARGLLLRDRDRSLTDAC